MTATTHTEDIVKKVVEYLKSDEGKRNYTAGTLDAVIKSIQDQDKNKLDEIVRDFVTIMGPKSQEALAGG